MIKTLLKENKIKLKSPLQTTRNMEIKSMQETIYMHFKIALL